MKGNAHPELAIILLNWRNWADTIECLESVYRSAYPARVIVCDNASGDGSVEHILSWARGDTPAKAKQPEMARFTSPAVQKPISTEVLNAADVHAGARATAQLTLIETGGNLGFAGGNNIGLECALNDPDINYFWLLNNDTVIEETAPAAIVSAFEVDPAIGMAGSVVRYYYAPDTIQALNGARFNPWTGRGSSIYGKYPASSLSDASTIAAQTDYVLGASLAVSKAFLQSVGLMETGYFLYFEEMDWATRARKKFRIGYAPGAIVYHKEGGSIGSNVISSKRSPMSEFYLAQSKLRFTMKHSPLRTPIVALFDLSVALRRLLQGNYRNALAILKGSGAALSGKLRYWR